MVADRLIKGFSSLYWCGDWRTVAGGIRPVYNGTYRDRRGAWDLPRRYLV